jgi:hypothetical protein
MELQNNHLKRNTLTKSINQKKIEAADRIINSIVRDKLKDKSNYQYFTHTPSDVGTIKIINDAILYSALQVNSISDIPLHNNPVLKELSSNSKFFDKLYQKTPLVVSFESVVKKIQHELKLENKIPIIDSEKLMKRTDISNDVKLSIQFFLHRGKFIWTNISRSEFGSFVISKDTKLSDYAMINCWESILYMMYKANIVDKNNLKRLYISNTRTLETNLEQLFQFKNQQRLNPSSNKNDIRKDLSNKSYILMLDKIGGNGLFHDFISVPYTNKEILNMLLTGDYNLLPSNPKIYSLEKMWTNKKLNTVEKDVLLKCINNPNIDIRKVSLNEVGRNLRNQQ